MDAFGLPSPPGSHRMIIGPTSNFTLAETRPVVLPRGCAMVNMILLGMGGRGGNGAIGANSTAAGGGGGGSGGMTVVTMPRYLLPDILYVGCGTPGGSLCETFVAVAASPAQADTIAFADYGSNGNNASGATAGTGGVGGLAATATKMRLGWAYATAIAGGDGKAGGTTGAGSAAAYPTTGRMCMGGTGGGGLGNPGSSGSLAGSLPAVSAVSPLQGLVPSSTGTATVPPAPGHHGTSIDFMGRPIFFNPGIGGQATHGSATGAGLTQAAGGNGAYGSGGGGSGGALTGSTPAAQSLGGGGLIILTLY